jgi:hypothetical protein
MPKTTTVKKPPRTNIPIIDMHYAQLDTIQEVNGIQFKSVFKRLMNRIENIWNVNNTG